MKLPSTLSELLRLSLEDIDIVRKNPKYVIDMDNWHFWNYKDNKCYVCLSGAVMSNSLKIDERQCVFDPTDLNDRNQSDEYLYNHRTVDFEKTREWVIPLFNLNRLRRGEIWDAILFSGYSVDRFIKSGLPDNVCIPEYTEQNYEEWRQSLLELADQLEKAGF